MSDIEHILLHTGIPVDEAAQRLADVLHAVVTRHDDGGNSVRRPLQPPQGQATIGGVVEANEYGEANPLPGEESIYDGYDTMFEIWATVPGEGLQHAEAARIFNEIIANLPWPAVHTKVSGLLYSAWNPQLGRTDFPAGTGYDVEHRDRWQPYAHPTPPH